jgi:hypothetical protein
VKTSKDTVNTIHDILTSLPLGDMKIEKNVSDELMNLIEIVCTKEDEMLGILVMNNHCYIPPVVDSEPMVKRSVELK